jgi:hypothetical protein
MFIERFHTVTAGSKTTGYGFFSVYKENTVLLFHFFTGAAIELTENL